MNAAQHDAALRVERYKADVHRLSKQLLEAERGLKSAEAKLRAAVRRDPTSWGTLKLL